MSKERVELPCLGAPTADTHAHLDMLDDPAGALERAAIAQVAAVATVADVTETPYGTYDRLDSWLSEAAVRLEEWGIEGSQPPEVGIVVGAHPHNAKDFNEQAEEALVVLAAKERTIAIGEIGLDFHYDHSPRDDQRRAFKDQLALADTYDLPVVIHLRDAHDEGLAILKEVGLPKAGAIIHCFTGDPQLVSSFVELGCYISFAGPLTFKNAEEIRAAAKVVPLDHILVETDCPFMAPEPYRGRTNEPAWTVFTVERLAKVLDMDIAEVAKVTYDNARRILFDRKA